MLKVHPEYLVDNEKKVKAVVIPIAEWEKILEELEELDDIRAYDKAKPQSDEKIDFDTAVREIKEGLEQVKNGQTVTFEQAKKRLLAE